MQTLGFTQLVQHVNLSMGFDLIVLIELLLDIYSLLVVVYYNDASKAI